MPAQVAAAIGDLEVLEELFDKYNVDPILFREETLLIAAIESIGNYGVLLNSKFNFNSKINVDERNDAQLKKEIEDFFW